jgi:phage baseplate assembly protein V
MSLERFTRMLRNMVARAKVSLVYDEHSRQQLQLEILKGEARERVERWGSYGFTSVPHPGADALVIFVAGERSHGVAVCVDNREFRLTGLQGGEVALYDDLGNVVKLGRSELTVTGVTKVRVLAPDVEIVAESSITLDAPEVLVSADAITLVGEVLVNGNIEINGTGSINGKPFDETHQHGNVENGGGVTSGIV